ncbi:FG-GAP and VCBS repeat-containing protein [Streptomyces massasporeus]|uniref:FG-GAP and VCBS repeat-containing protein n=1 Tax=Streptomyces massasporeus TaxID=67324 RepID=UPI00365C0436
MPAVAYGAVPGDVNGDGYRDAVLPAPGANVAGKAEAGAVVVLYGAKSGLSTSRRAVITQNSPGLPGTAGTEDRFGAATATADLNRDGYADLVVGAPNHRGGPGSPGRRRRAGRPGPPDDHRLVRGSPPAGEHPVRRRPPRML